MQPVFDAHLHIIDPGFPLTANDGYLPDPFTVADYRQRIAGLPASAGMEVVGGAVVSGSFQGFDQTHLVAALAALGPGFVGVTQVQVSVTDAEIDALDAAGVRAVRFNLRRGGSAGIEDAELLARRVWDRAGWHAEFYLDARDLSQLSPLLTRLPQVSIDHLGLSQAGFPQLLRLAEAGAKIKATGFGRIEFDPTGALRRIAEANPQALMAGTDLPSTRADRPFADDDLTLVRDVLTPAQTQAALWGNAAELYLRTRRPGTDDSVS
ncbi:amidohydrolase family protein [Brevibacterium luteolum]|uniref:2-pyrone-4,6-dicarboxylate hydrolase n=1 Tax=Brevibacterium luteolum TaxID=199591 RepID=A0A2N6PFS3_9MICO|nr:amidohydrolase family protein [Brevibacterium luteolum]PMB97534.1 2-pyrone-4,6-dicarboxylate hydrolase [Brevibacterium luteolum]